MVFPLEASPNVRDEVTPSFPVEKFSEFANDSTPKGFKKVTGAVERVGTPQA